MMLTPEWLVEALIGATLLMLLVLAVRKPVARLWGAHMAYALWALPALRMVLPAIPGWQPLYVPVAQSNPEGEVALARSVRMPRRPLSYKTSNNCISTF